MTTGWSLGVYRRAPGALFAQYPVFPFRRASLKGRFPLSPAPLSFLRASRRARPGVRVTSPTDRAARSVARQLCNETGNQTRL